MKKLNLLVIGLIITLLFLAIPASAQQERQKCHRHQTGDIWIGCIQNAPATTLEEALYGALSTGYKENRPCWIDQKKQWLFFHWTTKIPIVILRKNSKRPAVSAFFSIHRKQSAVQ